MLCHMSTFYSKSQVLTKYNSGVSLPLSYIFVCLLCSKGMSVEGKAKQKSDWHLLRFFVPSPDLKFALFSGPDGDLSPSVSSYSLGLRIGFFLYMGCRASYSTGKWISLKCAP